MDNTSKIFASNRILGYVSNGVPLVTRYIKRRKENLVVTCVGKSFYTWGCNRFSLLSVSKQHTDDIICLAADTFLIFTSSGTQVEAWRRGVELIQTYRSSSNTAIHLLLPFGPHLIGVDESNTLTVWDIKTTDIYVELNLPSETFRVTAICHPNCYINKILLGSENGSLQLWNINTSKLIYTFVGWDSAVTVVKQAPALDVVGIGLRNGRIIIHNIKQDETLMTFMQDWGCVTSLSFRADGTPTMVSASSTGHIVIWHLEERRVVSQMQAHDASVTGLEFLPAEPLLVSSSIDNSLKLWIFDLTDGGARLLRIREGHHAPPNYIKYYDSSHVLSAGADGYLRAFNTVVEIANKNLGRALYRKSKKNSKRKQLMDEEMEEELFYSNSLPPVVRFASEKTREKEYDNIAAIHNGTPIISTWSFDKCKLGRYLFNKKYKIHAKFRQRMQSTDTVFKKVTATSICLTHCGNFILIGYSTGDVDKYNIQSGILRGSYGSPRAHEAAVTGVAVNNLNQLLITGSRDTKVKFWPFRRPEKPFLYQINLTDSVTFFTGHGESSILAVALDNFEVNIIDTDTHSVIRVLAQGHSSALTDITLSPDARWLVTASMDCTIKTWDIPSGKCLDTFEVDKPCTSITFCPTGGFLATTHVDCLGVRLWTNRSMFSYVPLANYETLRIRTDDDEIDILTKDLITLSTNDDSCPVSARWQNIFNIDVIRERNKAKEPPKVPQKAPFILPVIPSVNVEFDLSAINDEDHKSDQDLQSKLRNFTTFAKLLSKSAEDYGEAIDKIKTMSPSLVNFEIMSLAPDNGGSIELMVRFLDMIKVMMLSKKYFELSASYLGLFLKIHTSVVIDNLELVTVIKQVNDVHQRVWSNLENRLLYSISVSKFLRTV
ncbi:WD repeat-containing protein 36 [Planococcus citri]|uniref:WD repeat-containing protein 36 n=1 Tax=Planococcus citri TaxID=170843 RepID=UPI0031F8FA3A